MSVNDGELSNSHQILIVMCMFMRSLRGKVVTPTCCILHTSEDRSYNRRCE